MTPGERRASLRPASTIELAEAVRGAERLWVEGSNSQFAFRLGPGRSESMDVLSLTGLRGIIEYQPKDQVVAVRSGTSLAELQAALRSEGQFLPADLGGTVGGALSLGLPSRWEGLFGSWREWLLGATVVLADGTVAKAGSRAVKNVAGYDAHKLAIGSRGTLFVVAEAILRTYPLRALPSPPWEQHPGPAGEAWWIQRCLPRDYEAMLQGAAGYSGHSDRATSTTWRRLPAGVELRRFEGDWVVRSHHDAENMLIEDATQARFMRRAKEIFDPSGKLNSGEFGIL